MDQRLARFNCDPRFHPYLEKVLTRLPQKIREELLDDLGFQVVGDEQMSKHCALSYAFEHPVDWLVCLNPRLLQEAHYRILYAIANEIGRCTLAHEKKAYDAREADDLLIRWGFSKEVEAVNFDRSLIASAGYQTGYAWAKAQNRDYLQQHFGLYYDQWEAGGTGALPPDDRAADLGGKAQSIVDDLHRELPAETKPMADEPGARRRRAVMQGILVAIKEIKFQEAYGAATCAPHRG